MADDEKKIIIDEDWKAQVEREKQEAEAQKTVSELKEEQVEELSLFDNLVASVSAQALMAMGLVGQENQVEVYIDLNVAKHMIDTLMMLREKTEGNLSDDEVRNLAEAIGELQRVFAVRVQQAQETAASPPSSEPDLGTPPT
jgi:hypothetical protein